jgi:hypothetical protein
MDVRVHNITEVTEQINVHNGDLKFVTRTLSITDKDGNKYSLTMFSDDKRNLITHEHKEEVHA